MEKATFPAGIPGPGDDRNAHRTARLARLRAIGRIEAVAQRDIDAAEASLLGAFALADFVEAIRRARHD
jgi:hypothetical protein